MVLARDHEAAQVEKLSHRLRVRVQTPVQSATHSSCELDCRPLFEITREGQEWQLTAEFEVRAEEALLDTWRTVDSDLAAMSMVKGSVFSRTLWRPTGTLRGITFLSERPGDLWGVGGLTIYAHQGVELGDALELEELAGRIRHAVEQDDGAFAAMTMYSAASWLLAANLMREASLNYWAAVETVASELLPSVRKKAVYQWGDLVQALKPLKLSADQMAVLHEGYRNRGESSHGKSGQLVLAQHSLGVYPSTSYSLKLPTLSCKAAADIVFKSYFT